MESVDKDPVPVVPPQKSIRPKTHVNEGDAGAVEDRLELVAGNSGKAEPGE